MEKNLDEGMQDVLNTVLDIGYDEDNRMCDRLKAFGLALDHMRRMKLLYGSQDTEKVEKTILQLKQVNKKTASKKSVIDKIE